MSQKFQPETIVGKGTRTNDAAIWGESIVKEELPSPPPLPEPEKIVEETPVESQEEKKSNASPSQPAESPPNAELNTEPEKPVFNIDALRNESFALGVAEGRKQAEEDFENGAQTLLRICHEFEKLRETILRNGIGDMKQLVMDISEKIIRHSVKEQEDTIIATIQDAIHLAVKSDVFQIQINPEDLECLENKRADLIESISGLKNIIFQPDPSIERGGCKLESSCCTVDATLASQIKIIKDSVMATAPSQQTKIS
jgi:flagellar assembly protein FliH